MPVIPLRNDDSDEFVFISASAMHYFLTSICLLTTCALEDQLTPLLQLTQIGTDEASSKEDILETCSIQLCGIAFTTNTPSVLVNAFGHMFYCESLKSEDKAMLLT